MPGFSNAEIAEMVKPLALQGGVFESDAVTPNKIRINANVEEQQDQQEHLAQQKPAQVKPILDLTEEDTGPEAGLGGTLMSRFQETLRYSLG